jgi:hypothetical protein
MLAGKRLSPCDVAALKKCLEENKGDRHKVKTAAALACHQIDAEANDVKGTWVMVYTWFVCSMAQACVSQHGKLQYMQVWLPLQFCFAIGAAGALTVIVRLPAE